MLANHNALHLPDSGRQVAGGLGVARELGTEPLFYVTSDVLLCIFNAELDDGTFCPSECSEARFVCCCAVALVCLSGPELAMWSGPAICGKASLYSSLFRLSEGGRAKEPKREALAV